MSIRRRQHKQVGKIASDLHHTITLKSHRARVPPREYLVELDPPEFSAEKLLEFASFRGV